MICVDNRDTNPYFNIASEEYLLKNFEDDIFMLYRNYNSIVVGKHQNTMAEINSKYVFENNINVVRRLSGGGTVFHDLGNINFTFIQNGEREKLVDFKKFTSPIIELLQNLGVNAYHSGRNDILIEGFKISGNAEHVHNNRVLHHGTLLYSADLNSLSYAIKVNSSLFTDKSVKSVRSKVNNISNHLGNSISVDVFIKMIFEYITNKSTDNKIYSFNPIDIEKINQLVDTKYNTWAWNYGYSPKYQYSNTLECKDGILKINLEIEKGIITNITLLNNDETNENLQELAKIFQDIPHFYKDIKEKIFTAEVDLKFLEIEKEEFLNLFFGSKE